MEAADDDVIRLARVCGAFELGELLTARFLPIGVINRNWRVDTTSGTYAVKELHDSHATGVRRQHRTMNALIGLGVPIPKPLERSDGDPVYAVDGVEFTATAWAYGQHLDGLAMSLDQAAILGELLGTIHLALAEALGPAGDWSEIAIAEPVQTLTYLDFLLDHIRRKPTQDDIDEVALANLSWRRTILTAPELSAPTGPEMGPHGHLHGDFHYNNVLWQEGTISAVLDWDRVRTQSQPSEVIRTCLLTFGGHGAIDLPRTEAFVRGYRRQRPVTDDELADAERRMWWTWLNGFWPLDQHYEHGNTRFDHQFVSNASTFRWWTDNRRDAVAAITGRSATRHI
ncbi:MAG: phosphotransferase [Hamadaea sp.]|uniref:phosphotransferase n=1 Tax=Hamadaea sp. TaxID=2024425 RepID=UPI0017C2270B|nr:phosphotransferase [Hamadaea sp.]NUR70866.1 phosphotransferase [Hamadaea sp.]NUT20879.1 phosphotransferase [Hamadaea sp.]